MTTQEEARKSMAEARHHEEHIEENMLTRSQEKIEQSSGEEIEAEARDLMVEQRQHQEHTKETMLSRSEAEISKN
ncbi:MAG: hypothetical protein QNJ60_04110 [Xenococcaceae cyanobacterium MO_188.B19]|nr:hypothetical protein [Xenococcaceae cyanobacterium MO_188.B19]